MDLIEILRGVELFEGLSDNELKKVASLCMKRTFHENEIVAEQDEPDQPVGAFEQLFSDPGRSVTGLAGHPGGHRPGLAKGGLTGSGYFGVSS